MGIMYLIIFGAYVIFAILTVSFVALKNSPSKTNSAILDCFSSISSKCG